MGAPGIVPPALPHSHPLDAAARRLAFGLLERLRDGRVTVVEGAVRHRFGPGAADGLSAVVHVTSPHAYAAALTGSVGLARGYVDGLWDSDDPAALVRVIARNLGTIDRWRGLVQPLTTPFQAGSQWLRRNTPRRTRENVSAHYDIGNDVFEAMLDETMAYSCAVFPTEGAGLGEASTAKMDMVCRKLDLSPADRVVEVGSGWGGFAVHAASRYGCSVTTTTISREQYEYATERVARARLSGRVRVLLEDYRELRGTYDRLVSIEMIEAVGWHYLDTFFACCSRLLVTDGAMLLQAIVTSDALYKQWRTIRGLANAVIFPGGNIPSIEAITRSTVRATDMRLVHLEDITPHYPPTLRGWRDRFNANRDSLDPERYDSRFARLWEFYLAYCEGAFAERRVRDVQMMLARPAYRAESVPAAALGPEQTALMIARSG